MNEQTQTQLKLAKAVLTHTLHEPWVFNGEGGLIPQDSMAPQRRRIGFKSLMRCFRRNRPCGLELTVNNTGSFVLLDCGTEAPLGATRDISEVAQYLERIDLH
jgi:hypothetical protein